VARLSEDRATRMERRRVELLKDRRDLRAALIERRNQLDQKIEVVEAEIKKLKDEGRK
jgi:hypothetical protein